MCAPHTQFARTMAGGGKATATVNQSNPVNWEQEAKKSGTLLTDLTDERLREAQRAMARRLMQGAGRRSTFLTERMDAPQMPTSLLGGA